MEGAFACPDCGCSIQLQGLSPGRQVTCDWCGSLVEVPFIPRAEQAKRTRHERYRSRSRWWSWKTWPAWARLATSVLSLAIVLALGFRLITSRLKSAEEEGLARLVAESELSEKQGRISEALLHMETVVARARKMQPPPLDLTSLEDRRNTVSRKEAEAQLAELMRPESQANDPGIAVGRTLTLQSRASKDPALAGLETRIESALEVLRQKWAEADGREASRQFEAGRADRAMELCERQHRTADELQATQRKRLQAEAAALATRVIARHGVLVDPAKGQFTLGSVESYNGLLRPILHDALRNRGYLPRPAQPVWPALWSEHAPFRLLFEVIEHQDETYLQSPNRVSTLDGRIQFLQGKAILWRDNPIVRTTVPIPNIPAYQASRVAVSDRRSPDFERLLYDNARSNLIDRLGTAVRNIPSCPGLPTPGATAATGSE